ncbi:MAG: hypothetical protein A2X86_12285 [Bdellovibrionales bacterium GWA2_49_15]|nr:MAG: hypothetical protein A2X86_12285 [Bdellovibrionales bacterium GWA2_49_15]
MRYLSKFLKNDLAKKMLLLSGPRQVGKTTLSKQLFGAENCEYLNWDILKHRQIIKSESWNQGKELLIFDEIHKLKTWKNLLKGIVDEKIDQKSKQKILVTGSAKLETFRKSGDALTGRYFHYRIYPFDYAEALMYTKITPTEILERLQITGGFPEAFFNPSDANRLRKNRIEQVFQEDLRELSKIQSIKNISFLVELLRDRVGGLINYANLARDLDVSPPTVKSWIQHLERLYLIFAVSPYSKKLERSLKKDKKYFFYDCSLSNSDGGKFENLVAMTLLKFCHFNEDVTGENWKLFYFRDKEKREVDFIIERNNAPYWVIEVKMKQEIFNKGLHYLKERMRQADFFQISLESCPEEKIQGIHKLSYAVFSERFIKY